MSSIFRIKDLRQQQGVTQAELAARLALRSASTITMWENGQRLPPSSALPVLAAALGCTIPELYLSEILEAAARRMKNAPSDAVNI